MGMCREYTNSFYADAECPQEQLGVPGRVFLHQFPESTPSVMHYTLKEYPQRDLALRCKIESSWAVPVFNRSTHACVGVLEIVSLCSVSKFSHQKSFLGQICYIFQEFGLLCSDGSKHYEMQIRDENKAHTTAFQEPKTVLETVHKIHDQPLMDAMSNGTNVVREDQNNNLLCLEALPNGEGTMQVDSSHQPPLDSPNNGQNVVIAERNINTVTSSKERKRKMQREPKRTGVRIEVSLEDILKCAKMSREQATKELQVSVSTFKRVCRDYGIKWWPPLNIEKLRSFRPSPIENEGQAQQCLNSGLPSNQDSDSVAHTKPAFQDADTVTIRAKYENHMIKFRLSLPSSLVALQQEVAKRLNLEAGTYHVKYKENNFIFGEKDLQNCIDTFKSLGNTEVVFLLEPKQPSIHRPSCSFDIICLNLCAFQLLFLMVILLPQ